jgi:predicted kinase
MTCDDLGASELGEQVLRRVCKKLDDFPDPRLLDFYRTYRACVRAKVAALRTEQTTGKAESNAQKRSIRLLKLADRYAIHLGKPLALIVRGLSGTGKTTLAAEVADSIGAHHLTTDQIRKSHSADDDVTYDAESRRDVYQKMLDQASQHLRERVPVVADGTFLQPAWLQEARKRLDACGGDVVTLTCECPRDVAVARIRKREQQGDSPSDADQAVYEKQRIESASFPEHLAGIKINTTNSVENNVKELPERIRAVL